jgi:hypothetical protein
LKNVAIIQKVTSISPITVMRSLWRRSSRGVCFDKRNPPKADVELYYAVNIHVSAPQEANNWDQSKIRTTIASKVILGLGEGFIYQKFEDNQVLYLDLVDDQHIIYTPPPNSLYTTARCSSQLVSCYHELRNQTFKLPFNVGHINPYLSAAGLEHEMGLFLNDPNQSKNDVSVISCDPDQVINLAKSRVSMPCLFPT